MRHDYKVPEKQDVWSFK